jgi:hypothetical protein
MLMMMKKKKKKKKKKKTNRFSKRSASDALFRSVELRIKSGCDFFNKKERKKVIEAKVFVRSFFFWIDSSRAGPLLQSHI